MLGSRRRRPPNPPLTAMTANPNATMAATAVFNRRDPQQQSLSSAAAAAALRARPATPTNVAEVQTKRTMRRSASMSSTGTAPDGRPSSALQRRGSSGSMAEKTFRSPSPHRPATAGNTGSPGYGRPWQEAAPPVPALPENIDPRGDGTTDGTARQRQSQHRKANSLGIGPTPVRVASQRLGKEGSPSWFGAAQVGDMKNIRTSDAAMTARSKSPAQGQDEGRPSSRASSINFSYPGRARVGSPPASPIEGRAPELPSPPSDARNKRPTSRSSSTRNRPVSTGSVQSLVYDPNSRRMVPRYEPVSEDSGGRAATEKMGRKQKGRTQHTQGASGRAQAAPTEPGSSVKSQPAPATTRNQHTTVPVSTQEPDYYQEEPDVKAIISSPRLDAKRMGQQRAQEAHAESNLSEADGNAISLPSDDTVSTTQPIRRKPSVVREESEPEEGESGLTGQHSVTDALDAVPTRQRIYTASKQPTTSSAEVPGRSSLKSPPPPPQQPVELAGEALSPQEVASARQDKSVVFEPRATSDIRSDRTHSSSPARTAHFGSVQDSPDIRHSPPNRSVSPRKPALKQRSPSRELSPDGTTSEASSSVNHGEELAVPRKKAVRVSFNDANTILVGEPSTSQQIEAPSNAAASQTNAARRPWYSSIARGKKKDLIPLDDDEVMKPRPALPSFGSVRDKKFREASSGDDERPLVRPYEPRTEVSPAGASSDSAIGELLLRQQQEAEQVSRNAANISRFREPLPPVVTSVDGGGYMSDSSSESEQEGQLSPVPESSTTTGETSGPIVDAPQAAEEAPLNGSALPAETIDNSRETRSAADSKEVEADIPAITISQPTPPPSKTPPPQASFGVPGGFPEEESETSAAEVAKTPVGSSVVEPPRQVVLEPEVQAWDNKPTLPALHTPATVLATSMPADEDTDTSDSGIYSDAYEDLSDIEEGGFQSLDAVVESPISRNSAPLRQEEPQRSSVPTPGELGGPSNRELKSLEPLPPKLAPDLSSASTVVRSQPSQGPDDDWEKAKAFWRSLTAEKRAQLEREAREDAGVEGDLDGSPKPAQKMKKKKSVDRRNSERKALAVHMAQQMMAKQQDQRQLADFVDDDRNYMIKPGTKVGADGFTRVPHDDVPPMRKTMRKGGSILKPSSRDGRATTEGKTPTMRVTSSGSQGIKGHARQTSEVSSSTAGTKSSFIPNPLRRRGSGSSESSFKRSPIGQSGGFAFRKTMRQPSPAGNERTPTKRFSLRSLSPTGGFSRASPPSGMRQTLREPPARESKPSTASRIASFGRGGAKKGGRGPKLGRGGSKASSRFGDSSDEEDAPMGSRFRSRFDDSSDEDDATLRAPSRPMSMPGALSASRGFQPAAVASPALPEEEEEEEEEPAVLNDPEKEVRLQTPKPGGVDDGLRRSRSGRGGLIAAPEFGAMGAGGGGSRSKKRSSLMSVLRRKKRGAGAIQRAEVMDSAARRDTPLERGAHQLKGIRSRDDDDQEDQEEELPTPQQQPRSPRLQKRTVSLSHDIGAGHAWPFPGREVEAERSGNLGTRTMSGSSTVGVPRQMTSASLASIGEGKKKRFGALRRVFRLPD